MGTWLAVLKAELKNEKQPSTLVPKVPKPPFGTFDSSPPSLIEKIEGVPPQDIQAVVTILLPQGFVSKYAVAHRLQWQMERLEAVICYLQGELYLLTKTPTIALTAYGRRFFNKSLN